MTNELKKRIKKLCLATITGYLVQAFFSNSIVSVVYIFWIFLGLLVANQSTGDSE